MKGELEKWSTSDGTSKQTLKDYSAMTVYYLFWFFCGTMNQINQKVINHAAPESMKM